MRRFDDTGGIMSSLIARNATWKRASYFASSSSSFFASWAFDLSICRRRTNARMISMFTRTARWLRGLVQDLDLHSVQSRQVRVEHDVVPAQSQDRALDPRHRNQGSSA